MTQSIIILTITDLDGNKLFSVESEDPLVIKKAIDDNYALNKLLKITNKFINIKEDVLTSHW